MVPARAPRVPDVQSHEFSFEVEAAPDEVWRALHPRLERGVFEHGTVRIEIVHPGDADGVGLVTRRAGRSMS